MSYEELKKKLPHELVVSWNLVRHEVIKFIRDKIPYKTTYDVHLREDIIVCTEKCDHDLCNVLIISDNLVLERDMVKTWEEIHSMTVEYWSEYRQKNKRYDFYLELVGYIPLKVVSHETQRERDQYFSSILEKLDEVCDSLEQLNQINEINDDDLYYYYNDNMGVKNEILLNLVNSQRMIQEAHAQYHLAPVHHNKEHLYAGRLYSDFFEKEFDEVPWSQVAYLVDALMDYLPNTTNHKHIARDWQRQKQGKS